LCLYSEAEIRVLGAHATTTSGAVATENDVASRNTVENRRDNVGLISWLAGVLECLNNVVTVVSCRQSISQTRDTFRISLHTFVEKRLSTVDAAAVAAIGSCSGRGGDEGRHGHTDGSSDDGDELHCEYKGLKLVAVVVFVSGEEVEEPVILKYLCNVHAHLYTFGIQN
jgi:hypothetical protein